MSAIVNVFISTFTLTGERSLGYNVSILIFNSPICTNITYSSTENE